VSGYRKMAKTLVNSLLKRTSKKNSRMWNKELKTTLFYKNVWCIKDWDYKDKLISVRIQNYNHLSTQQQSKFISVIKVIFWMFGWQSHLIAQKETCYVLFVWTRFTHNLASFIVKFVKQLIIKNVHQNKSLISFLPPRLSPRK
jgi:hypothetical protein